MARTVEMTQWLRGVHCLAEGPSSVPDTRVWQLTTFSETSSGSIHSLWLPRIPTSYEHTRPLHIHVIKIKSLKD